MVKKIIAKSEKKTGRDPLPKRESAEKEKQKSEYRKNVEFCNFLKEAFVVSGDVEALWDGKELIFRLNDEWRGTFYLKIWTESQGKEQDN